MDEDCQLCVEVEEGSGLQYYHRCCDEMGEGE